MSSLVEISPTTQLEAGTEKPEDKNKDQGSMRDANATPYRQDAFGNEESAEVRYKTLEWWYGLANTPPPSPNDDVHSLIISLLPGNAACSW